MSTELPSNREAERALIGAALLNGSAEGLAELVKPEHFLDTQNQAVWELIRRFAAEGATIDLVTITSAMKDGESHLPSLTRFVAGVPSSVHMDAYAAEILVTAEKRELARTLTKLAGLAYSENGSRPPGSVFDEAMALLEAAHGIPREADHPISAQELAAMTWPDEAELLPDFVPTGGLTLLAGEVGAGKTWLALDLHMALAEAGQSWGGRQVTRAGPTLYLGIDNSTRTLQRRIDKLALGRGFEIAEGFHLFQDPIDLSSDAGAARLRRMTEDIEAVLVTIDLLGRYHGQIDVFRMDEIGPVLMRLRRIADATTTAILIIHRLNKSGHVYGSVDIEGSVDSAVQLTARRVAGQAIRTVAHTKHRDKETAASMKFTIQLGQGGGLVLAFDQHVGRVQSSTTVSTTAESLYSILQEQEDEWLLRGDLRELLGDGAPGQRQFKEACSMLPSLEGVELGELGRAHQYRYRSGNND